MRNARKAAVARAAMAAFAPLGNLFVELGVSCPEAESLLRSVLVHGAYQRERKAGEKSVSLSRIALLTGVHRNEVKRILGAPPGIDPSREVRRHRGNRILSAWFSDPDYTSPDGEPKELDLQSERKRSVSFWSLVEKYAPGVWPRLILDELTRVGAVEEIGEDRLKVKMQSYGVTGFEIEAIEDLGNRAKDLLETLIHNLQNPETARLCETVLTLDADPKWLPVLRSTIKRRAQTLLTGLDPELNSPRTSRKMRSDPSVRIGVTVFSFEATATEDSKYAGKKAKRKKP
jgi:hypothetical protein